MKHTEIEVRFLEIDTDALKARLREVGAEDHNESLLEEVIVYDEKLEWIKERRFMRLRTKGGTTVLTYKEHPEEPSAEALEIEFTVGSGEDALALLGKLGFVGYRRQQKRRHSFTYKGVVIDIDTWPKIPPYVELEGESLDSIKAVAQDLSLSWDDVVYDSAREVIENMYGIPVGTMRYFTFDRFED
ncbi:MAG TPA: class IV adenylate cyclase [Candidatus Paceibacterota bacterium]|jgi:adenylate cyclase class 2